MENAIPLAKLVRKVCILNVSKYGQDIKKTQECQSLVPCVDHIFRILCLLYIKILKNGKLSFRLIKVLYAKDVG